MNGHQQLKAFTPPHRIPMPTRKGSTWTCRASGLMKELDRKSYAEVRCCHAVWDGNLSSFAWLFSTSVCCLAFKLWMLPLNHKLYMAAHLTLTEIPLAVTYQLILLSKHWTVSHDRQRKVPSYSARARHSSFQGTESQPPLYPWTSDFQHASPSLHVIPTQHHTFW